MNFETEINYNSNYPSYEVVQRVQFTCPCCKEKVEKLLPKHQIDYAQAFDVLQKKHLSYKGAVNEMVKVISSDIGAIVKLASMEIIRDGVRTLHKQLEEQK